MNTTPPSQDRVWAVISHLSVLAFGIGIALPVVGWADQRRKSNYASFQSLQALGYQSLGFTFWILSYLAVIILASIVLLAMFGWGDTSRGDIDPAFTPWIVIILVLLLGLFAIYFVLPIVAVVACALGRDFRYPIMGDRLARYLEYDLAQNSGDWLREDHELRWVAAMGHFSILVLLWGLLAPLTAWILHGKRSFFLKFQSVQTLVYQAVTTVLYFVALFLYAFGFLVLTVALRGIGELALDSPTGIIAGVVLAVSLLISFLLILCVPLLHILGQWAGYRVLKGDDYRYPWVGRWVDKWIAKNSVLEERLT